MKFTDGVPLNSRILGSAINIDVLIFSKWLAREDIKVQIVGNFFLGRGRFFFFLHASVDPYLSNDSNDSHV